MSVSSSDRASAFLQEMARSRALAILRGLSPDLVVRAVRALFAGGMRLFEVTTDSPGWEESLARLVGEEADKNGSYQVGVGTVLGLRQAKAAEQHGATFLVSPVLSPEVSEFAQEAALGYIPGAMTPGEIYQAHSLGATCIKVFPADTLGPSYISRVLQPMAFLKLLPTGGVSVESAPAYVRAGAIGVALGSGLVDSSSLRAGDEGPTRLAAARLINSLR